MAEPWTFKFEPQEQVFTFSNGHVQFAVDTQFETPPVPPESVTVESVTLTTPQGTDIDLGITNVEVPPPVIEHVASHFDLMI
jgi:hypothetical protein